MLFCLLNVIYSLIYNYIDNGDEKCTLFVNGSKNEELTAKIKEANYKETSDKLKIRLIKYVNEHRKIILEIQNSTQREVEIWEISSNPSDPCKNIPYEVKGYDNMVQLCLSRNYSVKFTKYKNGKKIESCYDSNTDKYKKERGILSEISDNENPSENEFLNQINRDNRKKRLPPRQDKKASVEQGSISQDSSSSKDIRDTYKSSFTPKPVSKKVVASTSKAEPTVDKNKDDKTEVETEGFMKRNLSWALEWFYKKKEEPQKSKEKKIDVLPIILESMIEKGDEIFSDISREEICEKVKAVVLELLTEMVLNNSKADKKYNNLKIFYKKVSENVELIFEIVETILDCMERKNIKISYETFIKVILQKIKTDEEKAKFADVMNMFLEHVLNPAPVINS